MTRGAALTEAKDAGRVSLLLGLLFGLAGMGSSSAAIALPAVAAEFGGGIGLAAWTISGYVLMLAIATPIYGRVSDLVGVRIPLLVGVGLMTMGALGATVATSFQLLLVARLLQGAGAASVPTLGVTLISARYDGKIRSVALGRLAAIAAAVSCVGPLAGGAVEHFLGWRAVMALPICGLLVLPLVWGAVAGGGSRARLDLLGAALVAGTSAGMVMIVQSPSAGGTVGLIGVMLLVLGVPLVARRVYRHPHGFLPASVIRNGTVVRSAVVGATVPASWFALLVGVPAALVAQDWEPWRVGLLLLPSAAAAPLTPRVAAPLLGRQGGARVLALAAVVSSMSLVVGAFGIAQGAPVAVAAAVMLTTGAFGCGQPAMVTAVGNAVHADVRGAALGIATLLFLVGGSIGSAVVAGLGELLGVAGSLLVLAGLPLVALAAVFPALRSVAGVPEPSRDQ